MDPNQSGWTKRYSGQVSPIFGSDTEVDEGRASWRRTSLDHMISAGVQHTDGEVSLLADISGEGPYWQSDDLMAPFRPNTTVQGVRTHRRIEKQILPTDKFLYVLQDERILDIFVEESSKSSHIFHGYSEVAIDPSQVGQWLIAEIDMVYNRVKWYISKAMI